jgi:ABC-type multidrug transport system fused ATPase/permease subunit
MVEKEKPNEIRKGIRALWRHIKPFKKELGILSALGLISAVSNGFIPYITGRFFDALIGLSHGESATGFAGFPLWGILLFVWAVVQLIANNIDWIMDRSRRRVDTKLHMNIQVSGFSHLFRLPISFHKNTHINGVIQKISQLSWRALAIMRTIIDVTPQFLSIIIGITLAASINMFLASILVVGVLVYIALLFKVLFPIAAIDSAAHRVWNEKWDNAAAAVQQIESVKQAATEEYESQKVHEGLLGEAYRLWYQIERAWSNVAFFQRTIVFFTQLTVFIFSVQFVAKGIITIGELVALNGYALMFFGPFVELGYSWQVIQNGITAAAHAEDVYNESEEQYNPPHAVSPNITSGNVQFDNVSFDYGENKSVILSDVSFHVKAGEVVALVGESGVGKSTTVALISGYYFPTAGVVSVDGVDTRKYNLTHLRKQIGVVPQEVALFNDTIKENIRYGIPNATDEEIKKAAKEAHIHEFIDSLPDRYGTIVGERGIKLSVGQKQRVAIARAILRDPKILIMENNEVSRFKRGVVIGPSFCGILNNI